MEWVGFAIVALGILGGALLVVLSTKLVHAVLWLGVSLVSTAALFVLLGAAYLAAIQVLLYVGGVMTLMIFGVMLTRRHKDTDIPVSRGRPVLGILASLGLLVAMLVAILSQGELPSEKDAPVPVETLGRLFVTDNVLAFEVLSILLLAAMVGAIVLSRRKDPGALAASSKQGPTDQGPRKASVAPERVGLSAHEERT
ncbi:MAG: NADH-quinone oxidoreductase subunit J [Deltaproteobacteria bacterium]|nr:NADH-quinone oxidoreductase subunit J [Deltaproteobacteria bacterium]